MFQFLRKHPIAIITFLALILFGVKAISSDATTTHPSKPKVLFTNFHPEHSRGHYTFITSIVTSPLANNYDFAVAVPKTSDIYAFCQKHGVKAYPCDFPGKIKELPHIIKSSKNFRKICNEFQPDIIHTNGGHDNTLVAWNALFLKKKPKVIRTFHALKRIKADPYHWLLYNKLDDASIFVAKDTYAFNTDTHGLHLSNLFVIENAIDLDKFKPQHKDLQLKKDLGIPENYFVFGSNAGLSEMKRIDLMLEALTHFKPGLPFKVIALGSEFPEAWHAKAKALGVDNYIQFPGFQKDVRPYCSIFDAGFILSTRGETASFATREMLAMGIPVISSDMRGLRYNIQSYKNGILVRGGNVQDIVDAMNYFLNLSPEELAKYKENARARAIEAYDANTQYQKISAAYQSLLSPKQPNPTPQLQAQASFL